MARASFNRHLVDRCVGGCARGTKDRDLGPVGLGFEQCERFEQLIDGLDRNVQVARVGRRVCDSNHARQEFAQQPPPLIGDRRVIGDVVEQSVNERGHVYSV